MKIKLVNKSNNPIPKYMSKGAAGFDIASNDNVRLHPNNHQVIHTGLFFEIPEGYELQIRPRSGFANKNLVIIPNSPATIDSDYRGELMIGLLNLSDNSVNINSGDRIAQGIINKIEQVEFENVEQLSKTERGDKGFNSTGK